MRALVVVAHPCDDSFCHAAAQAAIDGLRAARHEVDVLDLYEVGFRAAMSAEERRAYETDEPIVDDQIAEHAERLRAAEVLVFVYPSWWSGLPAILKGWLERVMVPGVGFVFDERTNKVRPGLRHVRKIVGINTWGSPRPRARLVNDNGRRVLSRALRMSCGWSTRIHWLCLYRMDEGDDQARRDFLERVERRMSRV